MYVIAIMRISCSRIMCDIAASSSKKIGLVYIIVISQNSRSSCYRNADGSLYGPKWLL